MMPLRRFASLLALALAATALTLPVAHAQARRGGLGGTLDGGLGGSRVLSLPSQTLPSVQELPREASGLLRQPAGAVLADLGEARQQAVDRLVRRHPDQVELDPLGQPMVRQEIVLYSPSVALLDAAQSLGFRPVRETTVSELGAQWVVLRPPEGWSTARALQRLREIDPLAVQDFNHLYLPAGVAEPAASTSEPKSTSASTKSSLSPEGRAFAASRRIGLIDGGVDVGHALLRQATIERHGCEGHAAAPDPHATAVASLMAGVGEGFRGAAVGARLYSADVYCGRPAGGSVEALLEAFSWLLREGVPVINISLVGPPNRLLERVLQAVAARGVVVVAAVGNEGPAAPPLYPAAYPGVVAVTGVDASRRALPEACRGPHVAFAAPGADLWAAGPSGLVGVRGTSFAAPLVAGLLAGMHTRSDPDEAAKAVAGLASQAVDLGAPGRDTVFGYGLVAEAVRTAQASVAHSR